MSVHASGACHLADGARRLFGDWSAQLAQRSIHLSEVAEGESLVSADVVFACGLLTVDAIDRGEPLRVIAAPTFPGRAGPTYCSVIIARRDGSFDTLSADARLAVNEFDSWSGWHGLDEHRRRRNLQPSVLDNRVLTGGHTRSITAVLDGRADVASIDITVWNDRTSREDDELVVIDTTRDWPAPPISIRTSLPASAQETIENAILDLLDVEAATVDDYTFMLEQRDLTSSQYAEAETDA